MEFWDGIIDWIEDLLGIKKSDKKKTQSRQEDTNHNVKVSEADMVKRLKILMSIPVNSPKYPDKLSDFLEQIWEEKAGAFETEGRYNEFTLYSGRLNLLKQYANERNGIRLKMILDELLGSLEEDRKTCLEASKKIQ